MFLDDNELAVELAATLKDPPAVSGIGDLPPEQQVIVRRSNRAAYDAILDILVNVRGLTVAQADTWARGAEFQSDIGQYFAILKINGVEPLAVGTYATWGYLDRRKELAGVMLLDAAGQPIEADSSSGGVGYGKLDTSCNTFRPVPRNAPVGRRTRW